MKQVIITKDKRILFLDVPKNFVVLGGKLYVGDGIPTEEAVAEWITVNGAHIPLNSQGQQIGGPKIGEKKEVAKNYKFRYNYTVSSNIQMRDKGHYIPKNSKVTGVKPIAKGDKVKQAQNLTKRYKVTDGSKWQKVRCNVDVRFPDGKTVNREVHYYYHPEKGEVDYKFPSNKNQKGRGAK